MMVVVKNRTLKEKLAVLRLEKTNLSKIVHQLEKDNEALVSKIYEVDWNLRTEDWAGDRLVTPSTVIETNDEKWKLHNAYIKDIQNTVETVFVNEERKREHELVNNLGIVGKKTSKRI
jgi:hypothetical protein